MTSSFPEQQYNPQARGGSFNPINQIDIVPAMQQEQQRQLNAEQQRLAEIAANDKVRVQNAGEAGRNYQALGQFSETLATQMVEYQKKENEKAMQRGMMDAYTDGVAPEERAAFDAMETELNGAKVAAEKDAADAEANGASVFTGEKIRKLSGWEKYGYYKGKMQIHSQGFPLYVQQNRDTPVTLPNGKTVTLNTAKEPEEQAAALSFLLAGYIEPYKEFNPTMVDKYMLTPLRGIMQQQMVLFAQKRGAEIQEERKAERLELFVQGLGTLDRDGALTYIGEDGAQEINYGQFGSTFILDYPGTPSAARAELADILITGVDNGSIKPETARRVISDTFRWNDNDPSASLLKKAPGVFKPVMQKIEDAIISNNTRESRLENINKQNRWKELVALTRKDDDQTSNIELIDATKIYTDEFKEKPSQEMLDGIYTSDEANQDIQRQYLRDIMEEDGTIAPIYTLNIDKEVLAENEFKDALTQGDAVSAAAEQVKDSRTRFLKGLLKKSQLMDEGGNFASDEAAVIYDNLSYAFDREFAAAIKDSSDPRTALATAQQNLRAEIGNDTAYQDYKDPTKFIPKELADQKTAVRKAIDSGIKLTDKLPNITEDNLKAAKTYLETGRGALPPIFKYLAQGAKVSAAQIAADQLKAYEYGDFKVPEIEDKIQQSDNPFLRELLYKQNTPSRTYRASIEDPELVNVLDQIAGVESEGSGGYDAYNQGGYSADEPIGSGDSSDGQLFGKPVSQMTIGELMKWQAKPKNQLGIHAAGRYQFIGLTLKEVVKQMGITKDMVFSPALQDAMALHRLRWRLSIQNSTTGLMNEWTGLKRLSRAELQQLLQDAQDVNLDPYNSPELLLKGLR